MVSVAKARIVGLVAIAVLGFYASLDSDEKITGLTERFNFATSTLDYTRGAHKRMTRDVPKALQHIQPWIASVGAAAAIGDIDGNLKADDVCYVDTRINRLVVSPLLGSAAREELLDAATGKKHDVLKSKLEKAELDGQSDFKPFYLGPPDYNDQAGKVAPMGCLIADLNEDGLPDILAYYWGRPPLAFLRLEPKLGVASGSLVPSDYRQVDIWPKNEPWFTNAAVLADINGDGHLDLVVGNYFCDGGNILNHKADSGPPCPGDAPVMQDSMSRALNGGTNRLLLFANGKDSADGKHVLFTEHADAFPKIKNRFSKTGEDDTAKGWTLAIAAQDLRGNGYAPDLYIANDFGQDRLLINCFHADKRFDKDSTGCPEPKKPGAVFKLYEGEREAWMPRSNVLGKDSFKGMGADFGDVDADGKPDLYVSNITEKWALQESQQLFLSQGQQLRATSTIAPLVNQSEKLGLSRSGWAWDAKLADFDNDGRPEALQAVGFVRGHRAGDGFWWRKSCWALLQELATANDTLLKYSSHWFSMHPGTDGIGCDLSGDSRRNPFFVSPAGFTNVFDTQKVKGNQSALTPKQIGRYIDVSDKLDHLSNRVAPTRGLAVGDANQDGLLDYIEAKQFAPAEFHLNLSRPAKQQAFIGLTPRIFIKGSGGSPTATLQPVATAAAGARSRPAIGAIVSVTLTEPALRPTEEPTTAMLTRQVDGGNGHSGKRSADVHFGLGNIAGDHARITAVVTVIWRNEAGHQSAIINTTLDQLVKHQALMLN